mgnify:CR=1 FL=1
MKYLAGFVIAGALTLAQFDAILAPLLAKAGK